MNQDLKQLHGLLLAQHHALYEKLDEVSDADTARTIVTEMQEILHRIDLVQGLLFRQSTAALKRSVQKVAEADAVLTEALESAQKAADLIRNVSNFLKFVDSAIDLAKTLAVA